MGAGARRGRSSGPAPSRRSWDSGPEGPWPARSLPYGDQRRLEIARALAGDPVVLMLDEPTAGMNAQETTAIRTLIADPRVREAYLG
ncbi:ATP-binding cassette domain-containing protein [Sinosporangium siamense]|uniref:ATP-binding cassette domain-containing protein n=1 Tax=Sinosporangium siamense TaxID=1367973 RepID=UPI0027DE1189|nr:ATP-binding cassette domain-containing protein [Sinosporangium siamense]